MYVVTYWPSRYLMVLKNIRKRSERVSGKRTTSSWRWNGGSGRNVHDRATIRLKKISCPAVAVLWHYSHLLRDDLCRSKPSFVPCAGVRYDAKRKNMFSQESRLNRDSIVTTDWDRESCLVITPEMNRVLFLFSVAEKIDNNIRRVCNYSGISHM